MKAAVVWEVGKSPVYSEFEEPTPHEDEVRIHVTASALTNFTKVRAAGKHFSFATPLPFVVGIDGVGRLEDGRRVYFLFPRIPFGGMAERTVVRSSQCIPVPDNVDDVTLAAIADPGMAAWAALEARAKLMAGETVLVNGATGSAGRMAVQIAKYLGAKKVVATGRNRERLNGLLSGRHLLQTAIQEARDRGARRLYIETNHRLESAVRLYESLGFRHLDPSEITPSPYERCDVYMEMKLD